MILLLLLLLAPAAHAATVHAEATQTTPQVLTVRLDATVRHGTTIHLEGCAEYGNGGLACGNGAGTRRKLHRGHNQLTVRVSNTVMAYTPPPQGTAEAWDAWSWRPAQTDVAFVYLKSGRLMEVQPTAIAAETLKEGTP